MTPLLRELADLLVQNGPWLVFLVVAVETVAFIGLLVPAEATVLLAAFLAYRGVLELEHVIAATLLGALVGDQLGYVLGRFGGRRVVRGEGWLGRMWRRHEARSARLFRRHSIVAVTLARFISFVRTLMPWFAGMSAIPYPRYLFFDVLGVLGWGTASIAAGYVAGESWHQASELLGTLSATLLAAVLLIALLVARRRRRRASKPAAKAGGGADAERRGPGAKLPGASAGPGARG